MNNPTPISPQAQQKLDHFRKKFSYLYGDWGHYLFACHAAFPLVYSPDLLYQLWYNFRLIPSESDRNTLITIDRMAVSDLILSTLSQETGTDTYQMDPALRNVLLFDLNRIMGEERVKHVAMFIYHYADWAYQHTHDSDIKETHQWTALATLDPQYLARELGKALSEATTNEYTSDQMHIHKMLQKLQVQDEQQVLKQLTQVTEGIQQQLYGNPRPGIILDPVEGEGIQRIKIAIPDLQVSRKEEPPLYFTPNLSWNLVYFEKGTWWIAFGATVGLPQTPLFYLNIDLILLDELVPYAYEDNLPEPVGNVIGKARTKKIESDRSELEILSLEEELNPERFLKPGPDQEAFHLLNGEITGSSLQLMEVWLDIEDKELRENFQQIISDFTFGSPFYLLFVDTPNSRVHYKLSVKDTQIHILTYPVERLIHGVEGLNRIDLWYVLTKLEYIARWERVLDLKSPDPTLNKDKLRYFVEEWGKDSTGSYSEEAPAILHEGPEVKLIFESNSPEPSQPGKQLSVCLENQEEIPVYVYLIALTNKFGIQLLPEENPFVEPGQTYYYNVFFSRDKDPHEAEEHIVAIIANAPLDLELLEQEPLSIGEILPAEVTRNVQRNLETFPELPERWLTKTLTIYQEERTITFPISIDVYPYPEDKTQTWDIVRESVGLVRIYSKGEEAPKVYQGFLISEEGYFLTAGLPSNYRRLTFQTSATPEPLEAKHIYDVRIGQNNVTWFSLFKITEERKWPYLRLHEGEITGIDQVTRVSAYGPDPVRTQVEDSSFHPEINTGITIAMASSRSFVYYSTLDYPVQVGLLMAPLLDHQSLRVVAAMNAPNSGSSSRNSDCYSLTLLFNEPDILQIAFQKSPPLSDQPGPRLKLEVPRPTIKGINYRDLLKAIGQNLIKSIGRPWARISDISQQTRDILISSRRAANDGQTAYLFIFESLVNTCLQLTDSLSETQSVEVNEAQIDLLTQDLDAKLQSLKLEIDRSFFKDPSSVVVLFELTFQEWLISSLSLPYNEAKICAERLSGLFKSVMVEVWREKPEDFTRLEAFFGITLFDNSEILDAYTRALQTNPNNAHAHIQRAKVREQSPGNYARILEDYKRAVKLEPDNFDYLYEYAHWLEEFEEFELAYEAYQQAFQKVPNWEYGLEVENKLNALRTKLAEINPSYNPAEAFKSLKSQVDTLLQNNNLRRALDVVYQFFRKLQDQDYFSEIQEIRTRFRDGDKGQKLQGKAEDTRINDTFFQEIETALRELLSDYEWSLQKQEGIPEEPVQTQHSESIEVDELTESIDHFREDIVSFVRRNQHGQAVDLIVKRANSLGIRELNDRVRFLSEDWQDIQRSRSQKVLSQSYIKDKVDRFEEKLFGMMDEIGRLMVEEDTKKRIAWLEEKINGLEIHKNLLEDLPHDMKYEEIEELINKLDRLSSESRNEEWLSEIHSNIGNALEMLTTTIDFAKDERIKEGYLPEEIRYDFEKGFNIVLEIIHDLEEMLNDQMDKR